MADLQRADTSLLDQRAGHVIAEMRKAMCGPAPSTATRPLRYRAECVQSDTDLLALADGLRGVGSARICLFGPPGTGKTEWAKFMAEHIGRPLHIRCGADLLGAYVGETEKRIRRAFRDAETEEAVLLVDEADSFLRDRGAAHQGWEVSMANQFLTSLEAFQGICVVSTNAMERLDPASARRFDFKVNFSWLTPEQNQIMFEGMLEELNIANDDARALVRVRRAGALTPGDYAAVARQNRVLRQLTCPSAVADALEKEMSFKPGASAGRRMGFVH
jgi:SpoVK/Ycf46/Vps4 family AAA+-type ATPase